MLNRWQGNTGKVQKIDEKAFEKRSAPVSAPPPNKASDKSIGSILKKIAPGVSEPLDSEDIILLLILYLMYRESGDSELLIIMGAMFLL